MEILKLVLAIESWREVRSNQLRTEIIGGCYTKPFNAYKHKKQTL